MRQTVVEGERDRLALLAFQPLQAAQQRLGVLGALELGERAGVAAFGAIHEAAVCVANLGARAAQPVEAAVAHDARHPGHRRRQGSAVLRRVRPDAHVALLQHLFGPVFTPQYTYRDAIQFRRRSLVEPAESSLVALGAGGEQPREGIAGGHRFLRWWRHWTSERPARRLSARPATNSRSERRVRYLHARSWASSAPPRAPPPLPRRAAHGRPPHRPRAGAAPPRR